jgi:hypothetical protein
LPDTINFDINIFIIKENNYKNKMSAELKLDIPEEYITSDEIEKKLEPIKNICHAMNDKGFKCSRRQKPDSIYCGKHNIENDHILDKYIHVSIKMINGNTYYVNKCGVVLTYSMDRPKVIGFIKDNKFFKVI